MSEHFQFVLYTKKISFSCYTICFEYIVLNKLFVLIYYDCSGIEADPGYNLKVLIDL